MEHMFASHRGHLGGLVVLGIDPGLTRCGYAVLQARSATKISALSLGVLRTSPKCSLPDRLAELHDELSALLHEFTPDAVAVEQVFFQTNVRTAMGVGQASGIALALAARDGAEVAQYTPSQIKNAVAGWGGANKDQIQRMVQSRLGLAELPQPPDAADAAAIALCHIACAPFMALQNAALLERQSST